MKKEKVTLIKPKKKNEQQTNFLFPILFILVGIILLTNSKQAIVYTFYALGIIFLLLGIYYLWTYYNKKTKTGIEESNTFVLGTCVLFIGILILILAKSIETFLRFIIGMILIYNGLKKLLYAMHTKNMTDIIIGIVLIGMGLYTVLSQNILIQVIGVFFIITGIFKLIEMIQKK